MCGCTDSRVRSQLRLTVWDHDKWTGDELVAGLWHPLDSGALIQNTFPGDDLSAPLPDPTWLPLRPLGHAATEEHVFVDAVRFAHPAGTLRVVQPLILVMVLSGRPPQPAVRRGAGELPTHQEIQCGAVADPAVNCAENGGLVHRDCSAWLPWPQALRVVASVLAPRRI